MLQFLDLLGERLDLRVLLGVQRRPAVGHATPAEQVADGKVLQQLDLASHAGAAPLPPGGLGRFFQVQHVLEDHVRGSLRMGRGRRIVFVGRIEQAFRRRSEGVVQPAVVQLHYGDFDRLQVARIGQQLGHQPLGQPRIVRQPPFRDIQPALSRFRRSFFQRPDPPLGPQFLDHGVLDAGRRRHAGRRPRLAAGQIRPVPGQRSSIRLRLDLAACFHGRRRSTIPGRSLPLPRVLIPSRLQVRPQVLRNRLPELGDGRLDEVREGVDALLQLVLRPAADHQGQLRIDAHRRRAAQPLQRLLDLGRDGVRLGRGPLG